jgi:hypothetical protein
MRSKAGTVFSMAFSPESNSLYVGRELNVIGSERQEAPDMKSGASGTITKLAR